MKPRGGLGPPQSHSFLSSQPEAECSWSNARLPWLSKSGDAKWNSDQKPGFAIK